MKQLLIFCLATLLMAASCEKDTVNKKLENTSEASEQLTGTWITSSVHLVAHEKGNESSNRFDSTIYSPFNPEDEFISRLTFSTDSLYLNTEQHASVAYRVLNDSVFISEDGVELALFAIDKMSELELDFSFTDYYQGDNSEDETVDMEVTYSYKAIKE